MLNTQPGRRQPTAAGRQTKPAFVPRIAPTCPLQQTNKPAVVLDNHFAGLFTAPSRSVRSRAGRRGRCSEQQPGPTRHPPPAGRPGRAARHTDLALHPQRHLGGRALRPCQAQPAPRHRGRVVGEGALAFGNAFRPPSLFRGTTVWLTVTRFAVPRGVGCPGLQPWRRRRRRSFFCCCFFVPHLHRKIFAEVCRRAPFVRVSGGWAPAREPNFTPSARCVVGWFCWPCRCRCHVGC